MIFRVIDSAIGSYWSYNVAPCIKSSHVIHIKFLMHKKYIDWLEEDLNTKLLAGMAECAKSF